MSGPVKIPVIRTARDWGVPLLSQALTPDANGATLDSQGLLTSPILEISPGRFRFSVSGGAAAVNPQDGAVILIPFRDNFNKLVTTLPRSIHHRVIIHTPFSSASGGNISVGVAQDAAMAANFGAGADYSGTDPRSTVNREGTFGTSAEFAAMTGFELSTALRAGVNPTQLSVVNVAYGNAKDASGDLLAVAAFSIGRALTTFPAYLYVSVFGSGVLAAATIEFSVEYFYTPLPTGERL